MKKTYVTHMDDHVGAFLQACKRISALGVNITRVSYDKSVDVHTLFIEVEGAPDRIRMVTEQLLKIGYLQDGYSVQRLMLLEFRLKDEPGRVLPVLEIISRYHFNISYISSQENGSGYQSFKMGLLTGGNEEEIASFVRESSKMCEVRVLSYDRTERNLDNTVFYLSFAGDIASRLHLPDPCKNELIIHANLVMQNLDDQNSSPYKTFEYIGRFADCMQRYQGAQFRPRLSIHRTAGGKMVYLIEPPCGSNIAVMRCGQRYLCVDTGFACYKEEQLSILQDILPDFMDSPRDALITHADVDHCGMLDEFDRVWMSRKCWDNFARERKGEPNFREENPLHLPYVKISKIVSGYRPPQAELCRVIGGSSEPQRQPLTLIGTVDWEELHFEAWEGTGGHVAGETVFIERTHRIVFSGDIYVNVKEFSGEQAAFNRLAPYLMTSVDSDPGLATQVRRALLDGLDKGEWLIFGGHGAALRYAK